MKSDDIFIADFKFYFILKYVMFSVPSILKIIVIQFATTVQHIIWPTSTVLRIRNDLL
jgi:hypothetical protein